MAELASVRRVDAESSTAPEGVHCRYAIAIGGVYNRTVSGAIAKATFQRWRDQPDVLVFGTLQTGFYWQWPDKYRTKVTLTPVLKMSAAGAVESAARRDSPAPRSPKGRR
jgi:hypothetical protein